MRLPLSRFYLGASVRTLAWRLALGRRCAVALGGFFLSVDCLSADCSVLAGGFLQATKNRPKPVF